MSTATLPTPTRAPDRRRTRLVLVLIAAGLVGVVLLVWALGGFERRMDRLTKVPPGTVLAVGPYELTFTSATVQYSTDDKEYEVVVTGTGRTTGSTTISPRAPGKFIFTKDQPSGESHEAEGFNLGTAKDVLLRPDDFTPGLPALPLTTTFVYTAQPRDTIRLVVFDLAYTSPYIFGDEKVWTTTDDAYDLMLPLTRLADRDY